MTQLVIIDYGSGNLRSVEKACARAMLDHNIQGDVTISNDPGALEHATHILLPGVGAFGDCMQGLQSIDGMLETLERQVHEKKKWFLGICVGMQLLFERGVEHGDHQGLGWLPGVVKKFDVAGDLKVPHMGWNSLTFPCSPTAHTWNSASRADGSLGPLASPLLQGINEDAYAYFVHSYHAQEVPDELVSATTHYGGKVVAAVSKNNIFGTQFHPEKSQETGLRLLANFLSL